MSAEAKQDSKTPMALTVAEAAESVRLSVDSITKEIKANRLPAKQYGSKKLIDPADLKVWFDSLPDFGEVA
jgi:excisionase family DNA binding protein